MSKRHEVEARTIHPRALAELGEEACIVALGVARDLRSGVIPPEDYNQTLYCGTSCCIAGHIAARFGIEVETFISRREIVASDALRFTFNSLFGHSRHERPETAADAIERYVYLGSDKPWEVPAMTGG